jgi:RHS repeat-associated protein
MLWASTAIAAVVISGGAVPASAAPVDVAAVTQQRILDRVRAAAAPVATSEKSDDSASSAETTINPGRSAILDAADAGVRAEFSGHDIDESLSVRASPLGDSASVSAASETGGVVAATPVEIRARTTGGDDVTQFPASYTLEKDASGIEVAKDVEPGVRLHLDVDTDALRRAGVDVSSLRVFTREDAGEPWRQLPSYFDADADTVAAESEHLSQFVVIGTPVQTTPVPRIVLDPDDDVGWANSPGPRVTELPYNVRLADQLAGMLRDRCIADVTVTRGADQRFVSADTRRAIAASHNPDVTLSLAFATFRGNAWGTTRDGGTQVFARGGADSDRLRDSLRDEMPGYTGRPAKVRAATPDFPRAEYEGLPGAIVHMETLFLDHNFDRPVIDGGWDSIVNGTFTGLGKYLESKGFSCTNPITGGWPARPSTDDLARWYQLGYRNWQHYGADPVSFSTGNLVEREHLFSLSGTGGSATDVSLVYNAQDGRLTRTGAGWDFGLGGHAQRFDDHSVLVVRGDGASVMFEPDGAGGFVDPRGEGLHLAEVGGGILRLTSRTDESWDFDAADQDGIGELVRAVDTNGRTTTLTYGPATGSSQFAPLTGITDAVGQTVRVDSDGLGRIVGFTLPDGRAWSLGYDGDGDLVRLGSPDGGSKTFTYDGAHRILTMTDATGTTYLRNEYDGSGRVVRQWDAAGSERRFDYGAGQTTYVDQEGRTHTYTFDERSRITRITDPLGGTQSWSYDEENNVTAFTDANGRASSYTYDDTGNVTSVTDAAGAVTRYTYTQKGAVASRTDALGRVTSYGYDAHGTLTRTVLPDGSAVGYDVDAAGNTTRMTLPSGASYAFDVDGRGNRTASTDPLGRVTRFAYDAGNRLVSSTDPLGRVTRYEWDARDRITAVSDPLGRTTRYGYDLNGNLVRQTDAAGNVTSYTWDALFRVVSATDAAGGTTTYRYDREDGLTGTTDAAGRQTSFVLDALSRVSAVTDPAGQTWKRSYDATGAPTAQTDPRGAVTTREVDALGRTTAVIGPTGIAKHTDYDAVGRVTAVTDAADNTTTYTYDDLDRITAVTDAAGFRTEYRYDVDGQLVGVVDRLGRPTLYERDAAGQVTAVTDAAGTTAYAYDPAGNLTSVTDATGRTSTSVYDAADQLIATTDTAGHRSTYEYDALGNVTAVTDPNGHTTRATWDAAGRRTSTTDATGATREFAYDTAGQLIAETDGLGHRTVYAYEGHGQLASVTDPLGAVTRYTYDELGQLASMTDARGKATTYERDAAGLPIATTDAAGARTRFEYDERGLLARELTPAGAAISYAYDQRGDRVQQSSASDVVRFEFDAEQRMIAATNTAGTTGWTYTPSGQLASQIDPSGRELAYAYDASGALTGLTVPGGQQIAYDRDAAGRVSRIASPWGTADYAYDDGGNLTGIARSNGVATRYVYDADDRVTGITSTTPAPSGAVAAPAALAPVRTGGLCPVITSKNAPELRAANVDKPGCVKPSSYLAHRSVPSDTGSLAQGASLAFEYAYDAAGNVTATTRTASVPTSALPGGAPPAGAIVAASDATTTVLDRLTTLHTYDAADRLTGSTQSTSAADAYGYDEVGNRTSWSHTSATASTGVLDPVLTVDATGATVPRPPASIATGSVSATDNSFTQSQVFNDLNQLVSIENSATGTQRLTHDPDGHRLSATGGPGGDVSYSWNEVGQLTGYTDASGSTGFGYDGLGRRVSTSTQSSFGTTSTSTVWDGLNPIQDTGDKAGTTTLVRDVAGELLLEGRSAGASTWDLLDRLGSAVAQVGDARLGSALNNPVQSARDAQTDRSARITQVSTGSDWGTPSFSTSGWSASVGYSGERSDPVAGLDLFYSRGYDTRSGSWLSKDTWTGSQTDPSSLNGYGFVSSNPVSLRDAYGFRPIGQYDRADSTPMARTRTPQRTVPQFTAPGLPGLPQPDTSAHSPSRDWNGTIAKSKVVTPKTTSQTTARHEDWWNPFSWSGDTWRNVGAVAAGVATTILVTAAATAAIAGVAACAAATAGLCAVGAAMVAGAIGGAAGGAVQYALSPGEKTSADAWAAVGSGAIGGAVGGGLGSSVVWAGQAIQSANRAATLAPAVIRVGDVKLPAVLPESIGRSARNGKGTVYDIPVGTPEISDRVAAIRIMDPVNDRKYAYPDGYATYMNKFDQAIDPLSGESLARTDPLWHIPLK